MLSSLFKVAPTLTAATVDSMTYMSARAAVVPTSSAAASKPTPARESEDFLVI